MKIKIFFSIMLVVLVIFLFGCGASQPQDAKYNFKQGVAEVQLRLLPNAPPENLYPGSTFKIIAEVDNQAGYDVINGKINLLGLDAQYFTVTPLEQEFALAGRSFTSPGGDKVFLEFAGLSGSLLQGATNYNGNYFISLAYSSTTEFTDTLCINPNLYDVYDTGCKVESKKSYGGQGSPLVVNKLEEIINPGSPSVVEFRLHLQNQGKGKVKSITLGKSHLSSKDLSCVIYGQLGLQKISLSAQQQELTVVCRATLADQTPYTTTVAVDFAYEYELVEQQMLQITSPEQQRGSLWP